MAEKPLAARRGGYLRQQRRDDEQQEQRSSSNAAITMVVKPLVLIKALRSLILGFKIKTTLIRAFFHLNFNDDGLPLRNGIEQFLGIFMLWM